MPAAPAGADGVAGAEETGDDEAGVFT